MALMEVKVLQMGCCMKSVYFQAHYLKCLIGNVRFLYHIWKNSCLATPLILTVLIDLHSIVALTIVLNYRPPTLFVKTWYYKHWFDFPPQLLFGQKKETSIKLVHCHSTMHVKEVRNIVSQDFIVLETKSFCQIFALLW